MCFKAIASPNRPSRGNRQGRALDQCGVVSLSFYAMNFYWRYQTMSGLIAVRSTREATPIQMAASKASSMYIASVPHNGGGRPKPSPPVPTGRARQRHVGASPPRSTAFLSAHCYSRPTGRTRVSPPSRPHAAGPEWGRPPKRRRECTQ